MSSQGGRASPEAAGTWCLPPYTQHSPARPFTFKLAHCAVLRFSRMQATLSALVLQGREAEGPGRLGQDVGTALQCLRRRPLSSVRRQRPPLPPLPPLLGC